MRKIIWHDRLLIWIAVIWALALATAWTLRPVDKVHVCEACKKVFDPATE
jgi:hypothetical protein